MPTQALWERIYKIIGFSRVLSCHAQLNNAVLIAKLKKTLKLLEWM